MSKSVPVALGKGLSLLSAILEDGGRTAVRDIAAQRGLATATAYRLLGAFVAQRLIVAGKPGRYLPGMRMIESMSHLTVPLLLAHVALPTLTRIARKTHQVAHLGILEEDMVTYACRAGSGFASSFTRPHTQLDAYCSALGKVLLADLAPRRLAEYLSRGALLPYTEHTIVSPRTLVAHLKSVRQQGYSIDDGEFAEELACVAVPIRNARGRVVAALSLSGQRDGNPARRVTMAVNHLQQAAARISSTLYGAGAPEPS